MWHISFMGNKKNQEFKNDVLPKMSIPLIEDHSLR